MKKLNLLFLLLTILVGAACSNDAKQVQTNADQVDSLKVNIDSIQELPQLLDAEAGRKAILGKWLILEIRQGGKRADFTPAVVEFKTNGNVLGVDGVERPWSIADDGKIITMGEQGKNSEGDFDIIVFDGYRLQIKQKDVEIVLEKEK